MAENIQSLAPALHIDFAGNLLKLNNFEPTSLVLKTSLRDAQYRRDTIRRRPRRRPGKYFYTILQRYGASQSAGLNTAIGIQLG